MDYFKQIHIMHLKKHLIKQRKWFQNLTHH